MPRTGIVRLVMLALLASAATMQPVARAHALELFGRCIFGDCRDDADSDLVDPQPYDVTITVTGADEDAEDAIRAASALWQSRERPAPGAAGLIGRAKGDYERILASLYQEARYGGRISIMVDGREASTLQPDAVLPPRPQVEIAVAPADIFRFGETRIVNAAPPTTDRNDAVDTPASVGFATGERAGAGVVRQAGRLSVEAWRQLGHPKAAIAGRDVTALHDQLQLDVTLNVEPGPRAVYGTIGVEGTDRMIASFVARQTGLIPGRDYDPDDLERARKRLERLGVFSSVSLEEADAVGADGSLPFTVQVQERKLRRIGVGATVSTVDGFGAEAFWLHRNLFGRAERLRLEGSVAGIDSELDPQAFDYLLAATLTLPGRFTPDTDIVLRAAAQQEVLTAYRRRGVEAEAGLTHFLTDEITLRGGVFVDYAEFAEPTITRRFGLAGVTAGARYDTRDSELDPTRGFFADIEASPFYEWEFGNAGGQLDADLRTYVPLGEEARTVLAGRLQVGALIASDTAPMPPDRLYLAGGGANLRGYPFRGVGVGDKQNGVPVPGRSVVAGSVEVRQDLFGNFQAAAFADAALVSAGAVPDFSGTVRTGVGFGVRYKTGLGPIRVDFAVPLDRQAGDPQYAIYAGIGQAF